MTDLAEAAEGVVALLLGGFIFIVMGQALSGWTTASPLFDFRLWGVLYLLAAIVLTTGVLYAAVRAILN
ncbi:hypothetical protein [Salinigranum marinum]|uniref:hypothetical protein n=1 Tax=Salinigranum marinum TaxID=1515595 RepID=UPI002989ECE0|nr:hypothetical protein [Salinigranum marinum]